MTKRSNSKSFEALSIEVPARRELAPIDPVLESLSDLAGRRDALRLMAERALAEADKLERELKSQFEHHQRQMAALAAQLGAQE